MRKMSNLPVSYAKPLLYVWQGILTTLSQSNGGYKYDYATVPFLAEVFKVLCAVLFLIACRLEFQASLMIS